MPANSSWDLIRGYRVKLQLGYPPGGSCNPVFLTRLFLRLTRFNRLVDFYDRVTAAKSDGLLLIV